MEIKAGTILGHRKQYQNSVYAHHPKLTFTANHEDFHKMACLSDYHKKTTAGHGTTQANRALIDSMYFVAWNTPTTEGTVVTNQYL